MKVSEIQAQCERPSVGENRVMVENLGQQTFLDGETVTYKCSTGYRIVDHTASRTITCVGTMWTNLELTCTKKSCGALPDFPNGRYDYPDGILFGAKAIAQCNQGYFLIGKETRNCLDSGWDGRDPECEVVKCAPPPNIQNGRFEPLNEVYDYSQAVIYSCHRDYTLIGESLLSCSDNGTFHPAPPQCLLVVCDAPVIENAVRVEGKRPPYGYKNVVRYECVQGYKMNGSGSLVCEENGWNPPPPTCIGVKCAPPPKIQNGTFEPINEVYVFKETVAYSCNQDYTLVGESLLTCIENGNFYPTPPQCSLHRIPDPPTTSPPSGSTCVNSSIVMIAVVYLLLSF